MAGRQTLPARSPVTPAPDPVAGASA
jgi:hypothetical protein